MNTRKIKTFANKYALLKILLYPAIAMRRFVVKRVHSYQEEIYHNLCDLLIEDPVISIGEFRGIFAVDFRSDLFKRFLLTKQYEPELVKYCLKFLDKERDAIDVGANIGFYTVLFAKMLNSKKVLSIEPTVNALQRLYRNIKLNNIEKNVTVFEGAATNHLGITQIKTINGREEYSTLGEWKHPSISKEKYFLQETKVVTIDEIVNQYSINPGFMKVDVEGMEHFVFEGSKRTLENNRPIILAELSNYLLKSNGSSAKGLINFIKSYEYDVYGLNEPNAPITSNLLLIEDFANIICMPKEMRQSYDKCKNAKFL